MYENWSGALRSALDWVLPLYRDVDFAYFLAAVMTAVAVGLCALAIIVHLVRSSALNGRIRQISSFISFGSRGGSGDADDREAQFAARFAEIDARMRKTGMIGGALAHAWQRYRKTLTFVGAPPIRSTRSASSFFFAAVPPATWLGFAANMLVAFGLLATFLGLVAALTFAAEGMASDDVAAMQSALRDLLSAAASKFVTSVAGIGLSIILRLVERVLIADLRARVQRLSGALEFGIRVDTEANSAALADRVSRLVSHLEGGETPRPEHLVAPDAA